MGVNLWGESPLYVNPVNVLNTLTKVLAEGKGGIVRDRLMEAEVQSYNVFIDRWCGACGEKECDYPIALWMPMQIAYKYRNCL